MTTKTQDMCSMCQAEPQDMLILSCRHNLCLDCATEVYHLNSKEGKILCEICLSETGLDNDTIVCLRSLSAKNFSRKSSGHQGHSAESYRPHDQQAHYPPPPAKSQYTPSQPTTSSLAIHTCPKHSQPLTYYCLQCNNHKICSQCMLLEPHRYHKVVTLKKASLQIKETIEKVGREKLKLKNLLEKDRKSLQMRKDESERQLESNLEELKQVFDQIVKVVEQKREELGRKMQQEAARKLEIMQGAINEISQKITLIEETVQFQDQLINSSFGINSISNSSNTQGMFQMFEYYESQMTQNRVDFEPSLPNFISEVSENGIIGKERVVEEVGRALSGLRVSGKENGEDGDGGYQDEGDDDEGENINFISQIENENVNMNNYVVREADQQRQHRNPNNEPYSMTKNPPKRSYYQQQNLAIPSDTYTRHHPGISQNIKIIQSIPQNSSRQPIRQQKSSMQPSLSKKSGIQAIKRKARENLKDREMSHSRKMELSRSIQNATDILNKIQERSAARG